jgi:hypothetical protein
MRTVLTSSEGFLVRGSAIAAGENPNTEQHRSEFSAQKVMKMACPKACFPNSCTC